MEYNLVGNCVICGTARFSALSTGLVSGSRVEATGVEIQQQEWVKEVLSLTLDAVPLQVLWRIGVTPSGKMP